MKTKSNWQKINNGYRHVATGTVIEKNSNPTGIRKWWINPLVGGTVAESAAAKGCLGGFFKLSNARAWVEYYAKSAA